MFCVTVFPFTRSQNEIKKKCQWFICGISSCFLIKNIGKQHKIKLHYGYRKAFLPTVLIHYGRKIPEEVSYLSPHFSTGFLRSGYFVPEHARHQKDMYTKHTRKYYNCTGASKICFKYMWLLRWIF